MYKGFYINLDRSEARRRQLENVLHKLGIAERYQRFPAIDGAAYHRPEHALRPGEVGCFLSHLEVLRRAADSGGHCHVIEDDVLLSSAMVPTLDSIVNSPKFDQWDVLVTDTLIPGDFHLLRKYRLAYDAYLRELAQGRKVFQIFNAQKSYRAVMSSVVYHAQAIPKLIAAFEQVAAQGFSSPVDLCLRKLAQSGQIRLGVLFPFLTSVNPLEVQASTLEGRHNMDQLRTSAAYVHLRASFYVERDLPASIAELKALAGEDDAHGDLLAEYWRFAMSQRHTHF